MSQCSQMTIQNAYNVCALNKTKGYRCAFCRTAVTVCPAEIQSKIIGLNLSPNLGQCSFTYIYICTHTYRERTKLLLFQMHVEILIIKLRLLFGDDNILWSADLSRSTSVSPQRHTSGGHIWQTSLFSRGQSVLEGEAADLGNSCWQRNLSDSDQTAMLHNLKYK